MRVVRPPKDLAPATRRWWLDVTQRWELEPHHVRLLTLVCQAWDRVAQARALLATDGLTTSTRDGGLKTHPAIKIEQEARRAFAHLLRELDLDVDGPAVHDVRPPALRSLAGGKR